MRVGLLAALLLAPLAQAENLLTPLDGRAASG
jgi:hypothetical protein